MITIYCWIYKKISNFIYSFCNLFIDLKFIVWPPSPPWDPHCHFERTILLTTFEVFMIRRMRRLARALAPSFISASAVVKYGIVLRRILRFGCVAILADSLIFEISHWIFTAALEGRRVRLSIRNCSITLMMAWSPRTKAATRGLLGAPIIAPTTASEIATKTNFILTSLWCFRMKSIIGLILACV